MHSHRYRITVEGALGRVGCEAFEEFSIVSNDGHTSLIADLDQAALYGALIRIQSLGLELMELARMQARLADGQRQAQLGLLSSRSTVRRCRHRIRRRPHEGRLLCRGDSGLYGLLDRIQDAALQVIRHYAPAGYVFLRGRSVPSGDNSVTAPDPGSGRKLLPGGELSEQF